MIRQEETITKYVVLAKEYDIKKQRIVNKYYFTNTQQEAEEAKKRFDDFYEKPTVLAFKFSNKELLEYRRFKILKSFLSSLDLKDWTNIIIIHYGY